MTGGVLSRGLLTGVAKKQGASDRGAIDRGDLTVHPTASTQCAYPGSLEGIGQTFIDLRGWLQNNMVYLSDGSSIPLLLGFNVEQLRYSRPTRYRTTTRNVIII